jgi:uncharacterized protein
MKLHEHVDARMNLVMRHGDGQIQINGQAHSAPCIVAPGFLCTDWIPDLDSLTAGSLAALWPLEPRVLLLGATARQHGSIRELRSLLTARQIALEVMDLGAACRTYNVLAQEDRPVAALLFP